MAVRAQPVNTTVIDQVDFLQGDFYTRVTGIVLAGVTVDVFFNNTRIAWPKIDGSGVTDQQVTSGSIYFHEFESGYYSVRFRPNALGFWRVIVSYPTGTQSVSLDYDIVPPADMYPSGLRAKFIQP